MSNYQAQDSLVSGRQLKVQEVSIPFSIVGNASAASVLPTNDEPAIMFVRTAGVDQITPALSAGESLPTFVSPVDATGVFNIMLVINETLGKVCSAKLVSRVSAEIIPCTMANTTGIDSVGNKICLNVDSAVNLTSGTIDACLEVKYTVV